MTNLTVEQAVKISNAFEAYMNGCHPQLDTRFFIEELKTWSSESRTLALASLREFDTDTARLYNEIMLLLPSYLKDNTFNTSMIDKERE